MNFRRAVTVGEKHSIKEENAIKHVGRRLSSVKKNNRINKELQKSKKVYIKIK